MTFYSIQLHTASHKYHSSALNHHVSNYASTQCNSEERLHISRLFQFSQPGLGLHFSSPYSLRVAAHTRCQLFTLRSSWPKNHLLIADRLSNPAQEAGAISYPSTEGTRLSCLRKTGDFHGKVSTLPLCRTVLCRRLPICLPGRLLSILFFENRVLFWKAMPGKNSLVFLSLFFFFCNSVSSWSRMGIFLKNTPFLPCEKGISIFWQGLYTRTQTE